MKQADQYFNKTEIVMKNLSGSRIAAFLMACCLLFSCSEKDENLELQLKDQSNLKSESTNVFPVSPCESDDTEKVQQAFDDAAAAGPGSVVELTAGQFYCNNIVVENFNGTFRGAGQDLTKIDVLRGLDPDAPGVSPVGVISEGQTSALFTFRNGNIQIRDMTFEITPYEPAEEWIWHGEANYDLNSIIWITGSADSRIKSTTFIGHEGSIIIYPGAWNTRVGIAITGIGHSEFPDGTEHLFVEPGTTGSHVINNCSFKDVGIGISIWGLINGNLQIGGNGSKGNKIIGGYSGILMGDNVNSQIEISDNYIESLITLFGIWIRQFSNPRYTALPFIPLTGSSSFLIEKNTIVAGGFADGIGLYDYNPTYGLDKSIDAVITKNDIILDNTVYGGIYGYFTQDVKVLNNKVKGNGFAGIYFGAWWDLCDNWLLLGNNVDEVNTAVAPILLGFGTSNCTVVGGENTTNVLDLGTNNILTGVNNQGNPPGPEIHEAIKEKVEFMKSFKY